VFIKSRTIVPKGKDRSSFTGETLMRRFTDEMPKGKTLDVQVRKIKSDRSMAADGRL
jgi:hypothetical protein